jgi:predicted aminopeptidase
VRKTMGIGIAAPLLILLAGCRMGYVVQAGLGQFRLLRDSIPIEQALVDDSLTGEERERLRLVSQIRTFGVERLGLKETPSYRTVYLKSDQPPIYLVAASPKDRLIRVTWWFPVVGEMPYLGFFDRDKAVKEMERLSGQGMDVYLGMAEAYSTLGWFDDPVTLNLIKGSTVDLVETILHEMTHTTLYVAGQAEFNEGLAVLIGKEGAVRFFEKRYGPNHPLTREARESFGEERMFSGFLDGVMERLEAIYGAPSGYEVKMVERERCFMDAAASFEVLNARLRTRRYAGFGRRRLNNAYLMTVGLYHRHFHVFEAVLEAYGGSIERTLAFFRELSRERGNLLEKTRAFLVHRDRSGTPIKEMTVP